MSSVSKNPQTPPRVHLWPPSVTLYVPTQAAASAVCPGPPGPIQFHFNTICYSQVCFWKHRILHEHIYYNSKWDLYIFLNYSLQEIELLRLNMCNYGAPNVHWNILPTCSQTAKTDKRKRDQSSQVYSSHSVMCWQTVVAVSQRWVATHTIVSILKQKCSTWDNSLLLKSSLLSWIGQRWFVWIQSAKASWILDKKNMYTLNFHTFRKNDGKSVDISGFPLVIDNHLETIIWALVWLDSSTVSFKVQYLSLYILGDFYLKYWK